jgi:hypothetical protein
MRHNKARSLSPGLCLLSRGLVPGGRAQLLALAPGAIYSKGGEDDPPESTFGRAAGVSISQAHKLSCSGECCFLARLNDPPTDK